MNPFYPSTIPPPKLDEFPCTFFSSANNQPAIPQTCRHTLTFQVYRVGNPEGYR